MIRTFQIALVNKVPAGSREYFNYSTQNEITYTLWEHLVPIAVAASGFIPGPSWSLRAANLQPHDVVVYFVPDPSSSVTSRAGTGGPRGSNLGGFTTTSPRGVVCEVYVDGNLPARRLANIAFHEIMHNKLDVGTRTLSDLHRQGGGGLARPPTEQWTSLTRENVAIMARHLFLRVPQYTGFMPTTRSR